MIGTVLVSFLRAVAVFLEKAVFLLWKRKRQSESAIPHPLELVKIQQRIINRMTNWQSHQWSRAGFPLDEDRLNHFALLKKPQR